MNPSDIQKFYGNKWCEFLALFPEIEIQETPNYYYKVVSMFGNKELRLFKNSKRITTKSI